MSEHRFLLVPFPDPDLPGIQIAGMITRERGKLAVHFSITGSRAGIVFPPAASQPGRRGQLWTATCLEFFLAIRDQPQYWEFNLAPSGDWNVYRMDAYRRVGFREEPLVEKLQVEFREEADCLVADAYVDLSSIIPPQEIIQVGVASIIQTRSGHETYWALWHPGPQADFHLREGFLLQL